MNNTQEIAQFESGQSQHLCEGYFPDAQCGPAFTRCFEYDDMPGALWVGNGEYENRVNFCPYCGAKAKVQCVIEKK